MVGLLLLMYIPENTWKIHGWTAATIVSWISVEELWSDEEKLIVTWFQNWKEIDEERPSPCVGYNVSYTVRAATLRQAGQDCHYQLRRPSPQSRDNGHGEACQDA